MRAALNLLESKKAPCHGHVTKQKKWRFFLYLSEFGLSEFLVFQNLVFQNFWIVCMYSLPVQLYLHFYCFVIYRVFFISIRVWIAIKWSVFLAWSPNLVVIWRNEWYVNKNSIGHTNVRDACFMEILLNTSISETWDFAIFARVDSTIHFTFCFIARLIFVMKIWMSPFW